MTALLINEEMLSQLLLLQPNRLNKVLLTTITTSMEMMGTQDFNSVAENLLNPLSFEWLEEIYRKCDGEREILTKGALLRVLVEHLSALQSTSGLSQFGKGPFGQSNNSSNGFGQSDTSQRQTPSFNFGQSNNSSNGFGQSDTSQRQTPSFNFGQSNNSQNGFGQSDTSQRQTPSFNFGQSNNSSNGFGQSNTSQRQTPSFNFGQSDSSFVFGQSNSPSNSFGSIDNSGGVTNDEFYDSTEPNEKIDEARQLSICDYLVVNADQEVQSTNIFKVILAGDGGCGKTSFVKRFKGEEFDKRYVATMGVEVKTIQFQTTGGPIVFKIWDVAGQEKLGGLRDGYYIGAHACMIWFDLSSRLTYKKIPTWHRDISRVCGIIPTVLIGNKSDIDHITFPRKKNLPYEEISVKHDTNLLTPFLHLAQELMNDPELSFIIETKTDSF